MIEHLRTLDGPLVVLEGNPHRDLIVDPHTRPDPSPFNTHFDSMIAKATGRRYYAQTWDGFHWTPLRGQTIAGGAFRGRRLAETSIEDFVAEMRKWGVRHLVVWSQTTKLYLDAAPDWFVRRWVNGRWAHYEMLNADVRDVVVAQGSGRLHNLEALGGIVTLTGVKAGEPVVLRANYFPAWTARTASAQVPLRPFNGQLAFDAPQDGTYDVVLEYPRRRMLLLVSMLALIAGCGLLASPVLSRH